MKIKISDQKGFTLIEMMIVVAIIGILAAIAYPNYTKYIRTTNRKAAVVQMNIFAQTLERYYTANNGSYTGENQPKVNENIDPVEGYTFDVCRETNRYQVFAKPVEGGRYEKKCGILVIDSYGGRGIQDDKPKLECWKEIKPSDTCFN